MAGTKSESSATVGAELQVVPVPAPITRNALSLPNLITISRLFIAVGLFALIYAYTAVPAQGYWLTAAALFLVAAGTDYLDGWIARRWGLVSTLGRILDPFADKIIVCGVFVFLQDRNLASGITAWMTIVVIGREMFVTSLRGFLERHGRDFSAALSGKIKMLMQCGAVTAALMSLSPAVQSAFPRFNLVRDVVIWATIAVTVWSGLLYVWRAYQMLRPPEDA
ncbi:MAG TPA: CDP-diacylglycerol--glycerol-3-phosphate 3-phosphatidyltransferase [Planctomycetaceae bacterium]|nr:CDP-diacylglycerol--glycerol-3-phosphate 3-phosphatidyltransferase [Planctomycetaceae bacterium]